MSKTYKVCVVFSIIELRFVLIISTRPYLTVALLLSVDFAVLIQHAGVAIEKNRGASMLS